MLTFLYLVSWPRSCLQDVRLGSTLGDKIRVIKNYLLNRKKILWFEKSLNETQTNEYFHQSQIEFDFLNNEQNTTFNQGFEQLHENAHILFRSDVQRLWQTNYIGMHSIDSGGPYRDSITSMRSDICSTRLSLFILCPNGRTNYGLNRDRWIPNVFPPNQRVQNKIIKQYRFFGQLMGMAIRRKHYLDLKFPNLLWKQLVREDITIKDIEDIDIQSFSFIKEIENNIEKTEVNSDTNYLFGSIMNELRFDVVSSARHIYELIPGGKDIPITFDNFEEYSTLYRQYRLNEFHRQIEYIHQGLCSVIPNRFLYLLKDNELEEAVYGKNQIDIQLLKGNTHYNNSNLESPYIQRFWNVLTEMFNEEQNKLFLKFVWGRNTLPTKDEDFTDKFSINLIIRNESEADRMFPSKYLLLKLDFNLIFF
jgi:hypothetical protein